MTEQPAGDPVRAFRTALARARRAEQTVRELRAENTTLRAQTAALERRNTR